MAEKKSKSQKESWKLTIEKRRKQFWPTEKEYQLTKKNYYQTVVEKANDPDFDIDDDPIEARITDVLISAKRVAPEKFFHPKEHIAKILAVDPRKVSYRLDSSERFSLEIYGKLFMNMRGVGYVFALRPHEAIVEQARTIARAMAQIRSLIRMWEKSRYDYENMKDAMQRELHLAQAMFLNTAKGMYTTYENHIKILSESAQRADMKYRMDVVKPSEEELGIESIPLISESSEVFVSESQGN